MSGALFARRYRTQARSCSVLGSPLWGALMERAADDAEQGGAFARLLAGHEDDPGDFALALRVFGTLHRLALAGEAPALAAHLPSCGGDGEPEAAWRGAGEALADHWEQVRAGLDQPPQTNEVGRSAALAGGFVVVGAATGLPLRLLEIGTSAGLNLRWDRFAYELSPQKAAGDPGSRVRIPATWFTPGARPPLDQPFPAVEGRFGCDRSPVDITTEAGALRLCSYVWPDQTERLERLRAAIAVARDVPASVEQADAVDWLAARLAAPAPGVARVVFHSIFWQYLDAERRDRLGEVLAGAAVRATPEAPLAWLRLEPEGGAAVLRLVVWPGGEQHLLARAGFHGPPVRWVCEAPAP